MCQVADEASRTREPALLRRTMPELDAVRGVAVLMVLLYHALFWSARVDAMNPVSRLVIEATQPGWLGVQLFFVLSGFLITGILVDGRERPGYFRRFYSRRARRILPAYLAVLTALAICRLAQPPFLIASLLFASNLAPLLGIPLQYGPLWSLAVEEQFYLFWPLLVRLLRPRRIAQLSAAIIIATPIVRLVAFRHGVVEALYSQTWFVADGLAFGALGALFLRSRRATRASVRRVSIALMILGATCLVAGAPFGIFHRTRPLGAMLQIAPWHALFAGGIGLMLLAGTGRWTRPVQNQVLRYFGRISYGLYLVHLVLFTAYDAVLRQLSPALAAQTPASLGLLLVRLAIAGGLATAVAALSREYFEEYFLASRRTLVPHASALADVPAPG